MTQTLQTTNFDFLKDFGFYKALVEAGFGIYVVGGAVRDAILGKEVKDYDLLITNTPLQSLIEILVNHGELNYVGVSFGILKLRPAEAPHLELDVSVPRQETKNGIGHQGFKIKTEGITLEQDLQRRDFTINSMALDLQTGYLQDPYNGLQDIQDKTIRLTNPAAFQEDPLRMLRAVQFSSRFQFKIEDVTYAAIKDNAHTIQEISGERILGEFEKVVTKGYPRAAGIILHDTKLWRFISGFDNSWLAYYSDWDLWFNRVETVAELVYTLSKNAMQRDDIQKLWKERLKGDLDGLAEIQALETANDDHSFHCKADYYWAFHKALKKSKRILVTKLLHPDQESTRKNFLDNKVPHGLAEVEINGEDLLALGYEGKHIGLALNAALRGIYDGELLNDKATLLAFVQGMYPRPILHENTTNETTLPDAGGPIT